MVKKKEKTLFQKGFWPVFIIIFFSIAGGIGYYVYLGIFNQQVEAQLNALDIDTSEFTSADYKQAYEGYKWIEKNQLSTHSNEYNCEKTDGSVVYVSIAGFGNNWDDSLKGQYKVEVNPKDPRFNDPDAIAVLYFSYDGRQSLEVLKNQFLVEFNKFVQENPADEVIIFGESAGGIVASAVASEIEFGNVEIHTFGSPLAGYNFGRFGEKLYEQMRPKLTHPGEDVGFNRELGWGIPPFEPTGDNVRVYHHKEHNAGTHLTYFCGDLESLCTDLHIQNNNVPGSEDFYYGSEDFTPVVEKIVEC